MNLMVPQLLMETAAGLSGLRSITSDGLFEGKRTTIVLLPHSVVFVNAFSGVVIKTIEFPRRDMVRVVDCAYVELSRCFVVAFSNATLTVVLQELMSTASVEYMVWPQQPLKLLALNNGGGVLIVCIDSTVWHLTLSDDKIVQPTFTKASDKNRDNLLCVGACSTAEGVTIIRKVDSDSSKSITGDYIDCSILSWNVPVSEGGSSRILEEAACVFSNFKIHKDEKFMSICAHVGSRSISVFFSSPIDAHRVEGGKLCQLRWRKYDSYNGSLLFEKCMGLDGMRGADKARNVFSAISAGPLLWLVLDGRASLWDPRYGVELCNIATYIPLDFPSERSTDFHAMGYSSDTSSSQTSIYALSVCVPHAGGCSIFNTSLKVPTAQTTGTLCNALGRLSPRSVTVTAGAGEHNICKASKGLRLSDRAIITSMSPEMQEDLLSAEAFVKREKLLFGKEIKSDKKRTAEAIGSADNKYRLPAPDKKLKHNHVESTKGSADRVLDTKREKVLYLDIPVSTIRCFLDRFEALAGKSVPLFNDWNMLHPLIISGTVSTAKGGSNASLVSQAIASRRFDILATVCRYTADLSERVAVRVLIACADAKPDDLSNLHIDQTGVLRYYRVSSTVGFARQGPLSPTTVKRQKKSKAVTVGLLMSVMMESMIRRRAAYSTILLSDTLKKLISPSFAVILLRVVMLFLKGLCTPLLLSLAEPGSKQFDGKERPAEDSLLSVFKCVSTHTGSPTASYNDIDIHNAVCWAEALLDSHFSSLAFRASFHAPTREALSCVMRTVATATDASQEVEKVLGLWTHVTRAARSGAVPDAPSTAFYQREALRL